MKSESADNPQNEEKPGVPGFRTWKGLYIFVFIIFVIVVAGLAVISRVFA